MSIEHQLKTVRAQFAVQDLETWPKNERGAYICNKEKPMPVQLVGYNKCGRWEHDDVKETDYDSDYSIEYKCHSCGHKWKEEMPD